MILFGERSVALKITRLAYEVAAEFEELGEIRLLPKYLRVARRWKPRC
jgi:hypothetical protein